MKTFSAVQAGGIALPDGQGRLHPIPMDGVDRLVTSAVERSLRRGIPLALVSPVAGCNVALAAAVTGALRLIVRSRRPEARVVVVTARSSMRGALDRVQLGEHPLTETLPRAVVNPAGALRGIGRGDEHLEGWIAFSPDLERCQALGPHLTVIDGVGRRTDAGAMRRAAAGAWLVYTTSCPSDPMLAELAGIGGLILGLDRAQIAVQGGDQGGLVLPEWACRAAETGIHELRAPAESAFDGALSRLWRALARAQHVAGARQGVAFGWGVAGALGQLAVPVGDHDRAARLDPWALELGEAVERAWSFAANAPAAGRAALEAVAGALDAALDAAVTANVKPGALARLVADEAAQGRRFVVAVRSRAAAVATSMYLDETPGVPLGWRDLGDVVTVRRLLIDGPDAGTDTAIVAGPPGPLYGGLMVVPPGGRLVVLAAGPWEASRARRQIEDATARTAELARGDLAQAARSVLGTDEPPGTESSARILEAGSGTVAVARRRRGSPWDPFDVRIVGDLGRREPDLEDHPSARGDRDVGAITVHTADGQIMLEPDRLVSRIRDGEEREVAAKSLAPGDELVLVDASARADLFSAVAARAQELPELAGVVALVDDWHLRASVAPGRSGMSSEGILAGMRDTTITSPATVDSWIRGYVHGPEDPQDLRRFAESVGDAVLERRYEATARAIETLRRYRRRLGMMLATAARGGVDDGWLDARLGIHLSDVLATLTRHRVVNVDPTVREIPVQMTDRLLPRAQDFTQLEESE